MRVTFIQRLIVVIVLLLSTIPNGTYIATAFSPADVPYPRAGWSTQLSTLAHGVSGKVTIVDAQTIVLSEFNYDGGGPRVYAYLGITNTNVAYNSGLPIGPLLTRSGQPYISDTLTLTLPTSQTLDGYVAISIWCADFKVNFGSGTFTTGLTNTVISNTVFLPLTQN